MASSSSKSAHGSMSASTSSGRGGGKPLLYKEVRGVDMHVDNFLAGTEANGHRSFLHTPLVCRDSDGIPGMALPPVNSEASEFPDVIGSDRLVTVLQVTEEREVILTFGDWVDYFSNPHPSDELNSVSFDVNSTALRDLVSLPDFISKLDLMRQIYPLVNHEELRANGSGNSSLGSKPNPHTELLGYHGGGYQSAVTWRLEGTSSSNFRSSIGFGTSLKRTGFDALRDQRIFYCSMSTMGCYADFHISFGGAASFYYVMTGQMWVYFVEPTPENLAKYEEWVLRGNIQHIFFGDLVSNCCKCEVNVGASIYVPSNWIHGVYFPSDTILFGSNFLTMHTIDKHLDAYALERRLSVPRRFRFPRFELVLWDFYRYLRDRIYQIGNKYPNVAGKDMIDQVTVYPKVKNGLIILVQAIHLWEKARKELTAKYPSGKFEPETACPIDLKNDVTIERLSHLLGVPNVDKDSVPDRFTQSWKRAVEAQYNQSTHAISKSGVAMPFPPTSMVNQTAGINALNHQTLLAAAALPQTYPSYETLSRMTALSHLATDGNNVQSPTYGPNIPSPTNSTNSKTTISSQKKTKKKKSKAEDPAPDQFEQLQCPKCMGFFTKKGLGPHRRYCTGEQKERYKEKRQVVMGPEGVAVPVTSSSHRSSCHRCGNLRKKTILCPQCPNIYCKRCAEKMRQEHGEDVFINGCPFCKGLCCCRAERTRDCPRMFHCYKKCPMSLNTTTSSNADSNKRS